MSTLELQKCLGHVGEAGMTVKKVELSQKLLKQTEVESLHLAFIF